VLTNSFSSFGRSVPTASAVGIEGDYFQLHCLAAEAPGVPIIVLSGLEDETVAVSAVQVAVQIAKTPTARRLLYQKQLFRVVQLCVPRSARKLTLTPR